MSHTSRWSGCSRRTTLRERRRLWARGEEPAHRQASLRPAAEQTGGTMVIVLNCHAAETDCVAGVVRLELRNPLGSKSARIAGEFFADLAETAQQRQLASELR